MKGLQELELSELYYLVYTYSIHGNQMIKYDIEYVWKKISDKYFAENNMTLDIYDTDERDILFRWLREKSRYQLLDKLMLYTFNNFVNVEENGMDNRDKFFINNVDIMNDIMNSEFANINGKINSDDINLSEISKDKIINIVKEMLLVIDFNGEWLKIYEEALLNKRIIYLNELSFFEENELKTKLGLSSLKYIDNTCLSLGKNKDWYIFLRYDGTINDITTTIHEIVHYINKYYDKGKQEEPLLREFSSIFYELYALDYMKKIGYDETEIRTIKNKRLMDTYMALKETRIFMYYLKMIIENGKITEDIDKEALKEKISYYGNCDNCIKDLIINPYAFFEIYPYIIGNYLANRAIEKVDNDSYLMMMIKYMTENLSSVNVGDVFRVIVPELAFVDNDSVKRKIR